jgi:hypothetical protein
VRCLGLFALSACNQVFGLEPTKTRSSLPFYDAPIDAPFTCPPIGTTPHFATDPHQVVYQPCDRFQSTADGAIAIATCLGAISQGPTSGPLSPVADLASTSGVQRQDAWLAPDGDQLVVAEQTSFVRYLHAGGDHWTRADTLSWPAAITSSVYSASTPTRGTPRRMLAVDNSGYLDELIDDGTGVLQLQQRYGQGALGIFNYNDPMLSPDGLRALVYGTRPDSTGLVQQSVWYTDRASLADDFRPFDAMPDVPIVEDPFMTEDCARVYFSGIGSIWYVQQL